MSNTPGPARQRPTRPPLRRYRLSLYPRQGGEVRASLDGPGLHLRLQGTSGNLLFIARQVLVMDEPAWSEFNALVHRAYSAANTEENTIHEFTSLFEGHLV